MVILLDVLDQREDGCAEGDWTTWKKLTDAIGDRVRFWVSDDTQNPPAHFPLTATLRYITPHVYMWVEEGYPVDEGALRRSANRFEEETYPTNRRYFGKAYSPMGFFSPEMCYSREVAKPIYETGHRWLILGGVACPVAWPNSVIHQIRGNGQTLAVFFRDDVLSNRIAFKQTDAKGFIGQLRSFGGKTDDIYVVTAMDAETFGHHIRHWEDIFLAEMYEALQPEPGEEGPRRGKVERLVQSVDLAKEQSELLRTMEVAKTGEIRVVTLSQLLELFPAGSYVEPRASSWSTSADDIQAGNPYPLWNSKENLIHQLQWQHLKIAIELTRKAEIGAGNDSAKNYADLARGLLDRAMQSDQFWWASRRPMWDINLVNRGLMQQREVVFNAYKGIRLGGLSEDEKTEAYYRVIVSRDLRTKITDQLFIL